MLMDLRSLDLRYEESDDERLLHELLAQLQAEYAKAAQPYIDRLAMIRGLRTPRIFIDIPPPEQLG